MSVVFQPPHALPAHSQSSPTSSPWAPTEPPGSALGSQGVKVRQGLPPAFQLLQGTQLSAGSREPKPPPKQAHIVSFKTKLLWDHGPPGALGFHPDGCHELDWMHSQDPFGLQHHRRNEHGKPRCGEVAVSRTPATVGCLVSGNPVSASSETKVVSASLRPPYKGGVQSLFVGGVGRQMDNSMKGRRKRGLHGVLSRMKGRQKKKFKKARECPFSLLVYFTSFVPDAHSTQPSLWGPKMWDSYRRVEHLWIVLGRVEEDPDGLWWQRKA